MIPFLMIEKVAVGTPATARTAAGIVYSCTVFGIKFHLELINEESNMSNVGVGKEDE